MKQRLPDLPQLKHSIWPAIMWSAFVFILLVVPLPLRSKESVISFPHADKLVHFLLFMFQSLLWHQYLQAKRLSPRKRMMFMLISMNIMYGILLEYIQQYTGREFDPFDMVANAAGAIAGCWVHKKIPNQN